MSARSADLVALEARMAELVSVLGSSTAARDVGSALATSGDRTSALERVVARFGLDDLERAVVVLAAGVELDEAFRERCKSMLSTVHGTPTVAAMMSLSPHARWSAFAPNGRLRRHRIVDVTRGPSLAQSLVRLEERVLYTLVGADDDVEDELLGSFITRVARGATLRGAYADDVSRVVAGIRAPKQDGVAACVITGLDPADRREVAHRVAVELGAALFVAQAAELPRAPTDRALLSALWAREARLRDAILLVEQDDIESDGAVAAWLRRAEARTIVSAANVGPALGGLARSVELARPTSREQRALWTSVLAEVAPEACAEIGAIVSQFDMGPARIVAATERLAADVPRSETEAHEALWRACRSQMRPRLEHLAERVVSRADWSTLVLPPAPLDLLRQIVAHARRRAEVLDDWGFGGEGARGLGLAALFVGPSGTGKTLAAEVIARAIGLDLYRVDLSQVVSKYIGETEKNLARIFDAADDGSAVLLFDEADALFGKRSETKDSHDRYANIEVGYLLQRIEAYRGVALLTSNFRSAIDKAFLRRFRFLVEFPFPDATMRAAIWRRMFPPEMPSQGLDFAALAKLHVPGGNIRTIALNAAFLAADERCPVGMRHVARAARAELAKLERPVAEVNVVEA